MFETLFQTEARRRANLRRDLTALAIATGLAALSVYGLTKLGAPEPRRVTAVEPSRAAARATPPTAPSSTPGTSDTRAGSAARPAASAAAGPPPSGGERTRRATAGSEPAALPATVPESPAAGGAAGDVAHTIPRRLKQGVAVDVDAWIARNESRASVPGAADDAPAATSGRARGAPGSVTTRTDLVLEADAREPGAFAIERSPANAPPAASVEPGTGETEASGSWRVTPRASGTHRLRLVAVDVRDSAGRLDTTGRRTVAAVDVPVEANAPYAVAGALAEARRTVTQNPALWVVTCAVSFLLGWRVGRRGAGRAELADVDGGVPPGRE